MSDLRIELRWGDDFIAQPIRSWCDWPRAVYTIWRYYRRSRESVNSSVTHGRPEGEMSAVDSNQPYEYKDGRWQ